jgi:hypothetical protein
VDGAGPGDDAVGGGKAGMSAGDREWGSLGSSVDFAGLDPPKIKAHTGGGVFTGPPE